MINAAIVGLGRWGQTLVAAVQGKSDRLRFATAVTRDPGRTRDFLDRHGLAPVATLDAALADDGIDAIVLATPHSQHADQIVASRRRRKGGVLRKAADPDPRRGRARRRRVHGRPVSCSASAPTSASFRRMQELARKRPRAANSVACSISRPISATRWRRRCSRHGAIRPTSRREAG